MLAWPATVLLLLSGPAALLGVRAGPVPVRRAGAVVVADLLCRLAPPGHEGELFGLYATTGRAVSFVAPTLVGAFTWLFGSDRAGIVGILVVLAAGLAALWPVRPPVDRAAVPAWIPARRQLAGG